MKMRTFFASAALVVCTGSVFAAGRQPASLLVYPIFDSRTSVATVVTVTNTNTNTAYDPSTGELSGTAWVEFRYINGTNCVESNRSEKLTPNDTFSAIVGAHNPNQAYGYLYVYAKTAQNGVPMKWNYLIGDELTVNGIDQFEYSANAFGFAAVVAGADRTPTNVDADTNLDLNNAEYEAAPAELLFPRFFGQSSDEYGFHSQLALVSLAGSQFDATIDFLMYNDNEYQSSGEHTFRCWTNVDLLDISGAFSEAYLDSLPSDDPNELFGFPAINTGWFRANGGIASSTTTSFNDPAFLALLVERVNGLAAADLPWENGTQINGDLLPRNLSGDFGN